MKLWEYIGKNVEIVTMDGEKIQAYANNYEDDTVNELNMDSIDLTVEGDSNPYSLYENEIKSIKVI